MEKEEENECKGRSLVDVGRAEMELTRSRNLLTWRKRRFGGRASSIAKRMNLHPISQARASYLNISAIVRTFYITRPKGISHCTRCRGENGHRRFSTTAHSWRQAANDASDQSILDAYKTSSEANPSMASSQSDLFKSPFLPHR